jgi:hypothetical protein
MREEPIPNANLSKAGVETVEVPENIFDKLLKHLLYRYFRFSDSADGKELGSISEKK